MILFDYESGISECFTLAVFGDILALCKGNSDRHFTRIKQ